MIGRNEPCPCGSGRKYKKCCLEKDRAKEIARNRIKLGEKQFNLTIQKISEAIGHDYKEYKNKCEIDFGIDNYELENLMNVYYLSNYKYNKQSSLLMDYFNKYKPTMENIDIEIIENTLNSYMSVYQIKEKDINKIRLRDILLNEEVYVEDIDLFSEFEVEDFLLARIIPVANTKIFVDKTIKITESTKTKIKNDIDNRFKQTKKKCNTKKQCLTNNIKFLYQNLIKVRREYVLNVSCDVTEDNIGKILKNNTKNVGENKFDTDNIKVNKIDINNKNTENGAIANIDKVALKIPLDTQIKTQIALPIAKPIYNQIQRPIDKATYELIGQLTDKSIIKPVVQSTDKIIDKPIDESIVKPVVQLTDKPIIQTPTNEIKRENKSVKLKAQNREVQSQENQLTKNSKNKKQAFARLAKNSSKAKKKVSPRLETKLKQRIMATKKIQGKKEGIEFIQKTGWIKNIDSYKIDQIESKIENISISKTQQQMESKIQNNLVAKMTVDKTDKITQQNKKDKQDKRHEKKKQEKQNKDNEKKDVDLKEICKVYNVLMSKIEIEYKEKCVKAWEDFKKTHKSYSGGENGWAAAIEYSIKKAIDETTTQGQISQKYNISVKTLSKRYKELKIS